MKVKFLYALFLTCFIAACVSPPDYPLEPQIAFVSLTNGSGNPKNAMRQGQLGTEDSLFVTISFTDGDGDLGSTGSKGQDSVNIFLLDKRDNRSVENFRMPFIPEQGAGNGISGEIRMLLFTTCCNVIPPCEPSTKKPIDTLIYDIYIKDRKGNKSNTIQSAPIYLQCK
jgi:hypothetical protein